MRGLPAHRQSGRGKPRATCGADDAAFLYQRPGDSPTPSTERARAEPRPPTMAGTQYLAGGTTILDLMKLDVMRPEVLVDINASIRPVCGFEQRSMGFISAPS